MEWADVALSNAPHELTTRSLAVYKSLLPVVTASHVKSLVRALRKFPQEALDTLQVVVEKRLDKSKAILFPQLLWGLSAMLFTTDRRIHEKTMKVLTLLTDRLDLSNRNVIDVAIASVPSDVGKSFPGLVPLLCKAVPSKMAFELVIRVLSVDERVIVDTIHPHPSSPALIAAVAFLPFVCEALETNNGGSAAPLPPSSSSSSSPSEGGSGGSSATSTDSAAQSPSSSSAASLPSASSSSPAAPWSLPALLQKASDAISRCLPSLSKVLGRCSRGAFKSPEAFLSEIRPVITPEIDKCSAEFSFLELLWNILEAERSDSIRLHVLSVMRMIVLHCDLSRMPTLRRFVAAIATYLRGVFPRDAESVIDAAIHNLTRDSEDDAVALEMSDAAGVDPIPSIFSSLADDAKVGRLLDLLSGGDPAADRSSAAPAAPPPSVLTKKKTMSSAAMKSESGSASSSASAAKTEKRHERESSGVTSKLEDTPLGVAPVVAASEGAAKETSNLAQKDQPPKGNV